MLGLNRMESRTGHCFACLCVSLCAPDMSSKRSPISINNWVMSDGGVRVELD